MALLVLLLLGVGQVHLVTAAVSGDNPLAWASPAAISLKQLGPASSEPDTPYVFPSLDCDNITYRPVGLLTAMRSGCFTATAFGLFNSDSQTVIFSGSDEALPLLPYSAHELFVPWPEAGVGLALDTVATGGQTLSLYKNLAGTLRDQRDPLGQLSAKQVSGPPDLTIRDSQGHVLVVNSQTLAFSPSGSWLVAETLNGSFVRINLTSLDITPFAPAFNTFGSPGLSQSEVAISQDGRFIAISNRSTATFKVYDLANCGGTSVNLQPLSCPWHDYWSFVGNKLAGLQAIGHVRFVNDGLLSFNAAGGTGSNATAYELAPADHISFLIDYLGLGDSYTSGEGAYDYLNGTDTNDNSCHLSRLSYPLLLTTDLFSPTGGHSVACSGAMINDVASTSNGYIGQMASGQDYTALSQSVPAFLTNIRTNFLSGYVAQQRFASWYQPAAITVSVGGDDAGFGDILERCVEPHVSRHVSDQTCFNTYEDRQEIINQIDKTKLRLTALYKQLLRQVTGTHLYVIGYPQIVVDSGNCALNVHLNQSELEFAIELVNYLNNAMEQAAASAGAVYVDISQALVGHRLCEAPSYNVAVNGLTAGKDGGILGLKVFGKESYHPTALGQYLMEQAVLRQTHNLRDWTVTTNPVPNDGQKLLKASKSGRAVRTVIPGKKLVPHQVQRGKTTPLKLKGSQAGLAANHVYLVQLDGPTGPVIGSVVTDNNTDLDTSLTLPLETSSGGHTLDLTGQNQAGEQIDVPQPIYESAGPTDSDGDGLPDTTDSCPTAINSGQDADQDGIDDTCDGFIGTVQQASAGSSLKASIVASVAASQPSVLGTSASGRPGSATGSIKAHTTAGYRRPLPGWRYWACLILTAWLLLALIYCLGQLRRESRRA